MKNHALSVLLLALAFSLAACQSAYAKMARQREMPEYAALLAAAHEWKTILVPVRAANGRQVHIATYESGNADTGRIVVLLHGVGADSQSWRFISGGLADQQLLAVDLLGCGQSDAPDAEDLGSEGYSPTALARCTLQALRAALDDQSPTTRLTLVGHSLGGMMILRMYGDDELHTRYRDVLDRVDSLVLLAPADVAIVEAPAVLKRISDLTDYQVGLCRGLGMMRDLAAQGECDAIVDGRCALQEEADRDVQLLTDPARRHAVQAMIRSALPMRNGQLDWDQVDQWVARYPRVPVPTLLLWGSRDPIMPVSMGYKLQAQIPGSRLRILQPAKHCLAIEQPRQCARLIREFLGGSLVSAPVACIDVNSPRLSAEPRASNQQ